MTTQIRKRILIFVVVGLFIEARQSLSVNVQHLIKEAKTKYIRFEKTTEDMVILQQTTTSYSKREIVSELKLFKKREKWRLESAIVKPLLTEKKTILIYDGEDTWMVTSLGKRKLTKEECSQTQVEGNWWDLTTEDAKIIGTESLNGQECYIIGFKEKDNPITKMWIDKKDLVLIKAEGIGQKDEVLVWKYSDFTEVGSNWKIPYKTEVYVNTEITSTVLIKSIEINKGLSNELFVPEKEKDLKIFDILKEIIK